jgi:hypothetical protein
MGAEDHDPKPMHMVSKVDAGMDCEIVYKKERERKCSRAIKTKRNI